MSLWVFVSFFSPVCGGGCSLVVDFFVCFVFGFGFLFVCLLFSFFKPLIHEQVPLYFCIDKEG